MTGNPSLLITGGFGNLGSWLTNYFAKLDYDVTVLSHSKKDSLAGKFQFLECDITDIRSCEAALSGKDFDFVIHTASVNDTFVEDYARKAMLVNALGTRNVLQSLKKNRLRNFVYVSTFHVYGSGTGHITEETPVNPRHDYATTHLFAEYYIRQFHQTHSLPYAILRLTNSYGCPTSRDSSKWYLLLNDLSRMAFEKNVIALNSNGKAQRDFVWMGTVCSAIESILKLNNAPNDIFNLGSGRASRLADIATSVQQAYAEAYGQTLPIQVNTNDKSVHTDTLQVDLSKLKGLIPFESENKFREEALNIFQFLEKNK